MGGDRSMTSSYQLDDVVYGRPAADAFDLPRALAERERRAKAAAAARSVQVELPTDGANAARLPQGYEPARASR
jgi:hypothetical protein